MVQNDERNIEKIKKELSNDLFVNLRLAGDLGIDNLVKAGYSYEEIVSFLTNYYRASGLDLINCNDVVKKTLSRSR